MSNVLDIPLEHEWPEDLPLPFVDFAGEDRNASIASPIEASRILRRGRSPAFPNLKVNWVLTEDQYDAFITFFRSLGNGVSSFAIDLRFPKNSELIRWAVRLVGEIEAEMEGDFWLVSGVMDLLTETRMTVDAVLEGWTEFHVQDPEESGEFLSFTGNDGSPYSVEE